MAIMQRIRITQRGSTFVSLLLAIIVVVVIGIAAYHVYQNQKGVSDTYSDQDTSSTELPASIQSQDDIRQAANALGNDNDLDDIDPGSLDEDIHNLL